MSAGQPAPMGAGCVKTPQATSHSHLGRLDINSLSNELLLQIIQWVCNDRLGTMGVESQKHALNVALCSRRFHALAEPVLYSGFTQSLYAPKSATNFLLYLSRILASPHLALCLKQFSDAARSNDEGDLLPVASEFTDSDWTRLRTALYRASTSDDEADRWIKAVEKGQWNAMIALLLAVAPNIEELEFTNWSYENSDYTYLLHYLDRARKLSSSVRESPFALSRLKKVSLQYWDTEGGFGFDVLKPFLGIKSVEFFHGHMVSEDFVEADAGADLGLRDPPLRFTAKDLIFTNSAINHQAMALILRCFPRLENFHYEFGGAVVGYADFEPPFMLKALEPLKPCLRSLTIITEDLHGISDIELYPIGSLADFSRLVSITTIASVLIGEDCSDMEDHGSDDSESGAFPKTQNLIDAVPSTLESLSLKNCSKHVVRHIFELVSQKECRTPRLRKIDLDWEGVRYPDKESPRGPIIHPGFSEEEVDKLRMACEAAGIEIVINYLPPRPKYVSFLKPGEPLRGKSIALGFSPAPINVTRCFPYPYEGYEEYCEENGCDPKTGGRPAGEIY